MSRDVFSGVCVVCARAPRACVCVWCVVFCECVLLYVHVNCAKSCVCRNVIGPAGIMFCDPVLCGQGCDKNGQSFAESVWPGTGVQTSGMMLLRDSAPSTLAVGGESHRKKRTNKCPRYGVCVRYSCIDVQVTGARVGRWHHCYGRARTQVDHLWGSTKGP